MKQKIEVPIITIGDEAWLALHQISKSGKLRAVHITKKHHVLDTDGHHCEQIHAKTSIRYHPKGLLKYNIIESHSVKHNNI